MSVLQIPIPVVTTLFAPIMTARTAALVNRDSLETGRLVKVVTIVAFFFQRVVKSFLFIFLFASLDIDECSADTNPCDKNAICANIIGSYSCTCKEGFSGNGTTCEGTN